MEAAGATLVDVCIPHAAAARDASRVTMISEAYAYHEPDLKSKPELYGKYTRQSFQLGAFFSAADYVQAQRVRPLLRQECAEAFATAGGVAVMIVPSMASVAPTFAGYDPDLMMRSYGFTPIWNLTGLPAISIPRGFAAGGLPTRMQAVGRP